MAPDSEEASLLASIHSNRSAVYLGQGAFDDLAYPDAFLTILHCSCFEGAADAALSDAEEAVSLRPRWEKAYYRSAMALSDLGRVDDALTV